MRLGTGTVNLGSDRGDPPEQTPVIFWWGLVVCTPKRMAKDTLYEAFGEAKTVMSWSKDSRCQVSFGTLSKRLFKGWPIEAALVLTAEETMMGWNAFGESKNLIGWLTDPRCLVPAYILKKRLEAGEPMETALTRKEPGFEPEPVPGRRNLAVRPSKKGSLVAFGETRALRQWALDERCHLNYAALKERVKGGLPVEAAMIFTGSELFKRYWAFGERKTLGHWLRDPRCATPGALLRARLHHGERLESAMTRPETEPLEARPADTPEDALAALERKFGILKLTLFGETKTASKWSKDPRCEISLPTLYYRIKDGWPEEPSILKPLPVDTPFSRQFQVILPSGIDLGDFPNHAQAIQAIEENGGFGLILNILTGQSVSVPLEKPEVEKRPTKLLLVTAWGETKSASDWVKDSRCVVGLETLYKRLQAKQRQWSPEAALTTPAEELFVGSVRQLKAKRFRAYGKTLTIEEWAKDPRCTISASTLRHRLHKGVPIKEALKR